MSLDSGQKSSRAAEPTSSRRLTERERHSSIRLDLYALMSTIILLHLDRGIIPKGSAGEPTTDMQLS